MVEGGSRKKKLVGGALRSSGREVEDGGFFVLRAEKAEDRGRFFVLRIRKIEESPCSNNPPHFRRSPTPLFARPIFDSFLGTEDRRWRIIRSSRPKIEDWRWGVGSSIFDSEDRKWEASSIFEAEERRWRFLGNGKFFEDGKGSSKIEFSSKNPPSSKNPFYSKNIFHILRSTPKIEEPLSFDFRSRRLGRNSSSVSWWTPLYTH